MKGNWFEGKSSQPLLFYGNLKGTFFSHKTFPFLLPMPSAFLNSFKYNVKKHVPATESVYKSPIGELFSFFSFFSLYRDVSRWSCKNDDNRNDWIWNRIDKKERKKNIQRYGTEWEMEMNRNEIIEHFSSRFSFLLLYYHFYFFSSCFS